MKHIKLMKMKGKWNIQFLQVSLILKHMQFTKFDYQYNSLVMGKALS